MANPLYGQNKADNALANSINNTGWREISVVTAADDSHTPTVSLVSIDRFRESSSQENISYRITFTATAGDVDLRNVEFEVLSDIDRVEMELSSLNALSSSVNVIRIKALDPDSITGEVTSYTLTGPTSSDPNAPR